ncbi:MAG: type III secretion system chaperone, partial [Parachlamydiales bacterium]|nr:type III secretion system chaperone [Parachlamydiales bacterium]
NRLYNKQSEEKIRMTQELIERFVKELAIEMPEMEKDKSYRISINEKIAFKLWNLEPGFYFHADLDIIPTEKKEDFFAYVMSANLLGAGTGDNRIGLDNDEKFLTLSYELSYAPKYEEFKEKLEEFVNYISYWKEQILKYKKEIEASIL